MKNSIYYFKFISGFFSFWFYLFVYPLQSQPLLLSQELVCTETSSYVIRGSYFVNAKDYLKQKPTEFVENLEKNLKIFRVFYDLNKNIGTLNGSSLMVMAGNLAKEQDENEFKEIYVKNSGNSDENEFKEIIEIKNSLVPVTLFSSSNILESKNDEENGFFKKNFVEKNSFFTKKKFFTIEDAYSSSPKFSFINISSQTIEDITIYSNDKQNQTLDSEQFIELSIGVCKPL